MYFVMLSFNMHFFLANPFPAIYSFFIVFTNTHTLGTENSCKCGLDMHAFMC